MSTPGDRDRWPKKNPTDNLMDYLKTHTRESILYCLLVLGILLLFANPLYGGVLVGIVTGIYFGNDIMLTISRWKSTAHTYGVAHVLISAGIILAFLISAPAIFLGMAISIGIKELFLAQSK